MNLRKAVVGAALAGTLCFAGTSASFAANHTYKVGSAQAAIDARNDALVKVNKWDRPKTEIAENLKLKPLLEGYKAELDQDIADLEKAVKNSEASIKQIAAENASTIEKNKKRIAEIDQDYKIKTRAHGEDLAKYYLKDALVEKANLEKENEKLNASFEVAEKVATQALKDNKAQLEKLINDRFAIKKELRNFRLNPCKTLGQCAAKQDSTPAAKDVNAAADKAKADKAKDDKAKDDKAKETPKPAVKDAAKKDTAKATAPKLAQTGATLGVIGSVASLLGLAGVAIRRKFN